MSAERIWRYEAPPGSWHYVARDPAVIKRPGEAGRWFPEAEAKALLDMLKATRTSDGEMIVDAMIRLDAIARAEA